MKLKTLTCLLVSAMLVGKASAVTLNPGDFISSAGEVNPVGATTLFSTNVSWGASFSFSGELTSSVLTNDTSNPFGGLTFTYQFSMDTNSPHAAEEISIGNFASFLTDVSYLPGSGIKPGIFTRSFESATEGDTIDFLFGGAGNVPAGTNSALLVIQTDAHAWAPSISSIIYSSAVPNIPTLAPVDVVPEPATFALAGVGATAFACLKRRQNNVKRNNNKKRNTEKDAWLNRKS